MSFLNIPADGSPSWKMPVDTVADLPSIGNNDGDARIALDTHTIYIWNGVSWNLPPTGTTSWGTITGTLSAQTDLQAALDNSLKIDGTNSPIADINWGGYNITNIQTLNDGGGSKSIDVGNRTLVYSDGTTVSLDYFAGSLYTQVGGESIDYNAHQLRDSGQVALSWSYTGIDLNNKNITNVYDLSINNSLTIDSLSGVLTATAGLVSGGATTTDLPEGTNLYYLDSRVSSYISTIAGQPNGLATLDVSGLVPSSQIPPIAITDTFVVASQAAMLALTAEVGDIAVRTDTNETYILQTFPPTIVGNWVLLLSPNGFISTLSGDVTTPGSGSGVSTVAFVGTSSAANVHTAELAANAATSSNTSNTIVKRDGSGNFTASTITMSSAIIDSLSGPLRASSGTVSTGNTSLTSEVSGILPIANGGSGQSTANAAFNAFAPSQTGNSGKFLTTDGSNTSWATVSSGGVTTVGTIDSQTASANGLVIVGSSIYAQSASSTRPGMVNTSVSGQTFAGPKTFIDLVTVTGVDDNKAISITGTTSSVQGLHTVELTTTMSGSGYNAISFLSTITGSSSLQSYSQAISGTCSTTLNYGDLNAVSGNFGVRGQSRGSNSGANFAVAGVAMHSAKNVGGMFQGGEGDSGTNDSIGCIGLASKTSSSGKSCGGYFSIQDSNNNWTQSNIPSINCALVGDNYTSGYDIFQARFNGATHLSVDGSGRLGLKSGSNNHIGTATLVAGSVTVANTSITANSIIYLTINTPGGSIGILSAPSASITAGTSFVINSSSSTDTSTVNWMIIEAL